MKPAEGVPRGVEGQVLGGALAGSQHGPRLGSADSGGCVDEAVGDVLPTADPHRLRLTLERLIVDAVSALAGADVARLPGQSALGRKRDESRAVGVRTHAADGDGKCVATGMIVPTTVNRSKRYRQQGKDSLSGVEQKR